MKELHLDNTWNRIHNCFNLKVATVLWHSKAWKVVKTDDFDSIINREDKTYIEAEFYDQKELCDYLYNNLILKNGDDK